MPGSCPPVLPVSRSHEPAKLTHLQCLRGLAALTVVLSHLPHWLPQVPGDIRFYDAGLVAVYVFFGISGYIIAYSHRGETGWMPARVYALKRVFRLLPAYLVFSAAAFAVHAIGWYSWDTFVTAPHGAAGLIAAFTLLPLQGMQSVSFLAVGWSLFYEVMFYLLFAAFFFNRRTGLAVIALAGAVLIVNKAVMPIPGVSMSWTAVLLFAGCGFGLYRGQVPLSRAMFRFLAVCGLAFLVTGILHPLRSISQPCGVVGAALVTLGAVGLDQTAGTRAPGWVHRALHQLGNVSYSLYLCHTVVHTALFHFFGPPQLAWGVGALYVIAPVGVAWVSYRLVERPAQQLGRLIAGVRAAVPSPALVPPPAAVESLRR